jgi:DinB family protein
MLSSDILNPLINSAFTRQITWFEASKQYPLDEFIETFYNTRERVQESLHGMTDAQVAFASPAHSLWSVSESITHLVYTQGFYINKLLDITTSSLPHIIEAARGFGEGAKTNVPVEQLRAQIKAATAQVTETIEGTRNHHDLTKTEINEAFGVCDYQTWMLLLLSHEVDHIRQIIAMRRLARTEGMA